MTKDLVLLKKRIIRTLNLIGLRLGGKRNLHKCHFDKKVISGRLPLISSVYLNKEDDTFVLEIVSGWRIRINTSIAIIGGNTLLSSRDVEVGQKAIFYPTDSCEDIKNKVIDIIENYQISSSYYYRTIDNMQFSFMELITPHMTKKWFEDYGSWYFSRSIKKRSMEYIGKMYHKSYVRVTRRNAQIRKHLNKVFDIRV